MNNLNKVNNKEASIKLIFEFLNSLIKEDLYNLQIKRFNKIINKLNNYIYNEKYEIYYNYKTLYINIDNYIFKINLNNDLPRIYLNNVLIFISYDDYNNIYNKYFILIHFKINEINNLEKQKDLKINQCIAICKTLIKNEFKRPFNLTEDIMSCY